MAEPVTLPDGGVAVARAFAAEPVTADRDARTVEVVWTTGARARNFVPGVGDILEELDLSPRAVRMDNLMSGNAPVLDTHRRGEATAVLGRVTTARLEATRGLATLKFSSAPDVEPVWQRILDGSLRNISVGYRVHRYEQRVDQGQAVYRAVDWEPYEISVVPVPVDRHATVRGEGVQGLSASDPQSLPQGMTMTEPTSGTPAAAPVTNADPPVTATRAEPAADAIRAERERIASLGPVLAASRALVAQATGDALHQQAIADGWTAEALRGRLWDAMVAGQRPPSIPARPETGPSNDDPAVIREAMADAIAVGIRGNLSPSTDRWKDYRGVRPMDMLREIAAARGETLPRNRVLLAERSMHSTSDFPLLLGSALNKVLLADYAQAAQTYRMFMARRTFNDFRAHSFLRVGDFPSLGALAEGGTIQLGTISEGREQVTLATYARSVNVTRQMLVNDELGAFSDFAGMIGRRVMDFENATAFTVVTSGSGAGPNLADGNAVFTTTRGNRSASGAAIDVTTLATGRQKLRERTSPDGIKLNLSARYLLTGPAYETIAWQYTSAQYVPATAATTNPFRGVYEPIVDANITGNNWYLFADPAVAPVYIYGFLSGAEGPQVRVTNPPGTDGAVSVEVYLDFGCGAIDWRGGWFNAGA